MISQHRISLVKRAVLFTTAFLLLAPQVLAGEHVRSANQSPSPAQPTPGIVPRVLPRPVTVAWTPVTISVAVTRPATPAPGEVLVDLRSPDGQRRTFSVEGGPSAIQTQPVLVLRPGESITIRLAAK
jgi:hypothetical protein